MPLGLSGGQVGGGDTGQGVKLPQGDESRSGQGGTDGAPGRVAVESDRGRTGAERGGLATHLFQDAVEGAYRSIFFEIVF